MDDKNKDIDATTPLLMFIGFIVIVAFVLVFFLNTELAFWIGGFLIAASVVAWMAASLGMGLGGAINGVKDSKAINDKRAEEIRFLIVKIDSLTYELEKKRFV